MKGIDSCVAEYEGNSIRIEIDYGRYSDRPTQRSDMENFTETPMMFGSVPGNLFTYRKAGSPPSSISNVYIETDEKSALGLTISTTDPSDDETVKRIYQSLRYIPAVRH